MDKWVNWFLVMAVIIVSSLFVLCLATEMNRDIDCVVNRPRVVLGGHIKNIGLLNPREIYFLSYEGTIKDINLQCETEERVTKRRYEYEMYHYGKDID